LPSTFKESSRWAELASIQTQHTPVGFRRIDSSRSTNRRRSRLESIPCGGSAGRRLIFLTSQARSALKHTARLWLPPVVVTALLRIREREHGGAEWEYAARWPEDSGADSGWNHPSILETQLRKWDGFRDLVSTTGPLGVAHEATQLTNEDLFAHNAIMSFGYVVALTAKSVKSFSILDWGGGLAHYSLMARALVPDTAIQYHCKDVSPLCTAGKILLPDVQFLDNETDAFEQQYDLVMASTSLQYAERWRALLHQLAIASRNYLYITGLPLIKESDSFVVIQRPMKYGYKTSYPCWFVNRTEFLDVVRDAGLELVREFLVGARPPVSGAPEQGEYRGFLFRRTGAPATTGLGHLRASPIP
jgi:putative methyltransferase (TIGR04325 family)